MKGRTTCPKCEHKFIVDLSEDKRHKVVCPKCNNEFLIKARCMQGTKDRECSWEEHGEPRKTILSSIKPKSNRPLIAAVILIVVFSVGIATSIFSETFINSSLVIASDIGLKGSVKFTVLNPEKETIENATIKIANIVGKTDSQGVFYKNNIDLGVQSIEISYSGFNTQSIEILVTPLLNFETTINLESGTKTENYEYNSYGCTIILMIFSLFALLAAINCLRRKHVDAAFIGSLIAILTLGFFFISSILSIIAFVLIWKSRDEFEDGKKGKTF